MSTRLSIKEMILEGLIFTSNFQKLKEAEWMKGLRKVAHYGKKMNPKVECQMILENLKFDFIAENKSKSEREKTSLFYEDRCDAAGMLIGGILLEK